MLEGVLKPCLHKVDKLNLKFSCMQNRCLSQLQDDMPLFMCRQVFKYVCALHCSLQTDFGRAPSNPREKGRFQVHSAFTSVVSDCCLSKQHRKSVWKGGSLANLLHVERVLADRGPLHLGTCRNGRSKPQQVSLVHMVIKLRPTPHEWASKGPFAFTEGPFDLTLH